MRRQPRSPKARLLLDRLDDRLLPSVSLVKDINFLPETNGSSPQEFTEVNGTLFFQANDVVHGRELWMSNGTSTGTVLVRDIMPGAYGSQLQNFTNFGGTLYFTANDGV